MVSLEQKPKIESCSSSSIIDDDVEYQRSQKGRRHHLFDMKSQYKSPFIKSVQDNINNTLTVDAKYLKYAKKSTSTEAKATVDRRRATSLEFITALNETPTIISNSNLNKDRNELDRLNDEKVHNIKNIKSVTDADATFHILKNTQQEQLIRKSEEENLNSTSTVKALCLHARPITTLNSDNVSSLSSLTPNKMITISSINNSMNKNECRFLDICKPTTTNLIPVTSGTSHNLQSNLTNSRVFRTECPLYRTTSVSELSRTIITTTKKTTTTMTSISTTSTTITPLIATITATTRTTIPLGNVANSLKKVSKRKETLEAKRERKAAKTLAIITGAFVICWLPFFVMAITLPLCEFCPINDTAASLFLWLGYFNSTLNPVIYTIFSPEFRHAFKRILFGHHQPAHYRLRKI